MKQTDTVLKSHVEMSHYIFVDKAGKEYEVLVNETTPHAYLYEDGFEIFKGTLSDITRMGLVFKRKVQNEAAN